MTSGPTEGDPGPLEADPTEADADPFSVDVAAAQAGSVPAFERLYRGLAPSVASYLRWHGVDDVDAVTNEVLAQAHRNLHRFTGDGTRFRSWVFTIAHHRMVDDRRSASRRPPMTDSEVREATLVGDVEEEALALLGDDRLRDLLEVLSPEQRDVLLLRVVGDLSLERTAEALGKATGAVKSLQHRALAALRRHLESQETDS